MGTGNRPRKGEEGLLNEEAARFEKLSGEKADSTPISRIGGFLDGYEAAMMGKSNCTINVNRMPNGAEKYIVARLVMNELWYWGSWDTKEAAERVAAQFDNGIVLAKMETGNANG